ncbi:MAG: alpha/beta fold hydrolase [Candidatus Beckwithbacteria bacterium]|nr:alpha/beta fold hydrolase [Candidatus Beckwithbacteria bacterium]
MNKKIFYLIGLLIVIGISLFYLWSRQKGNFLSPASKWIFTEKPLQKYSFPELRKRVFQPEGIWVEGGKFYYWVENKKVSGKINQPAGEVPADGWPVVIMVRGYVDKEIFQTGIGTQPAAQYFAKNGFLTLAPDFLGYGESDKAPENDLENRFLCPVEALQLIASVKMLPQANADKINIWGHSNGGQIALSVLEISGKNYPTVLWAPVSKPFPYSILYYTDEYDDYGKALRKLIAGFDTQYDANEFSIHNYYDWVQASVQIHQGTADESVPLKWSQDLEKNLKDKGKTVKLYIYPGADHNLQPGWDEAVQRSLEWFKEN